MSTAFCNKCGAALPSGSQFCLKCGAQVPGVVASSSSISPTHPTTNVSHSATPNIRSSPPIQDSRYRRPAHNKRRVLAGFLILLVIIVAVIAGGWWVYDKLTQQVDITAVNWQYSSCWQAGSSQGAGGLAFGATYVAMSTVTSPSYATCTINSVSISTDGFSVITSNVPLTVSPGGTQTISVTIGIPQTSYTGAITIVVQVSET